MRYNNVSVAQLDRVLASDAKGCGFNSRRIRHLCTTYAKVVLLI